MSGGRVRKNQIGVSNLNSARGDSNAEKTRKNADFRYVIQKILNPPPSAVVVKETVEDPKARKVSGVSKSSILY